LVSITILQKQQLLNFKLNKRMKKFLIAFLFLVTGLSANASDKPTVTIERDGVKFEAPADFQVTKGDIKYIDFRLSGIGDSIEVADLTGASNAEVWLVDSSNSKTDSLVFEVGAGNSITTVWSKTSGIALNATSKTTHIILFIPGDATTLAYQVTGEVALGKFRVRRVNVGDVANPTALGYPYNVTGVIKIQY